MGNTGLHQGNKPEQVQAGAGRPLTRRQGYRRAMAMGKGYSWDKAASEKGVEEYYNRMLIEREDVEGKAEYRRMQCSWQHRR